MSTSKMESVDVKCSDILASGRVIYVVYQYVEQDKDDWTDPECIYTSLDEEKAIGAANKYHTEIIGVNQTVITEIFKIELDSKLNPYNPNLWENSRIYYVKYNKPEINTPEIKDARIILFSTWCIRTGACCRKYLYHNVPIDLKDLLDKLCTKNIIWNTHGGCECTEHKDLTKSQAKSITTK